MSQNLLVERLKFAKRELTALKTAHKRGLGLLKIYETNHNYSDDGISTGFYSVKVTINFSPRFGAYPFFYFLGQDTLTTDATFQSITIEQIKYANSGYTAMASGRVLYWTESLSLTGFKIYSTAPIETLTFQWSSS